MPADAAQRIRNLNRRRRYHQALDRPKVWPGNAATLCRWTYPQADAVIESWCASLTHPESAVAYVSAWCYLNHLREH